MSRAPGRCDVYSANLDQVVGSAIRKTRPAVIVSNDSRKMSSTTTQSLCDGTASGISSS